MNFDAKVCALRYAFRTSATKLVSGVAQLVKNKEANMTKLAPTELAQVDAPSQLFKEVVDRNDLDWSSWFISSAPVALVASEQLVRQATDNRPAAAGPQRRWRRRGLGWFRQEPTHTLSVFPIGKWWFIGRLPRSRDFQPQSLAFIFESAPICTDNLKAARRVAEHYHFMPAESAGGIFWMNE